MSRIPSGTRKEQRNPIITPTKVNHRRINSNPAGNLPQSNLPLLSRVPQSMNGLNLNNVPNTQLIYPSQLRSPESRIPRPTFNKRMSLPPPNNNISPKLQSNFSSPSQSITNLNKMVKKIPLGTKVITTVGNYKGTLKYLGPTRFKEGVWAGIELDQIGTGKNNGSYEGVTYFTCPENTGIFIDFRKVVPIENNNLETVIENMDVKGTYKIASKLDKLENLELSPINRNEIKHAKNLSRTDSLNSSNFSNEQSSEINSSITKTSDLSVNNLRSKLTLVQKQNNLLSLRLKKKQANLEVVQLLKNEFIDKAKQKIQPNSLKSKDRDTLLLKSLTEKENVILELNNKLKNQQVEVDILNKELNMFKTNSIGNQDNDDRLKIDTLNQDIIDLNHQLNEKEDIIKSMKSQLNDIDNINNDNNQINQLELKLSEESNRLNIQINRYNELETINNQLKQQLDLEHQQVEQLKVQLEDYKQQVELIKQRNIKLQEDINANKDNNLLELESLRKENIQLKQQVEEINLDFKRFKENHTTNEITEDEEDEMESEEEEYEEGSDEESIDVESIMRDNELLRTQNEILKKTLEKNKTNVNKFEDTSHFEVPKEDRAQEVAELQNKIRLLEDENQRLIEVSSKTKLELQNGMDKDEKSTQIVMLSNVIDSMKQKEVEMNNQIEKLNLDKDELNEKVEITEEEINKLCYEIQTKQNHISKLLQEKNYEYERAESYKNAIQDTSNENEFKQNFYKTIIQHEEKYRQLQHQTESLFNILDDKEKDINDFNSMIDILKECIKHHVKDKEILRELDLLDGDTEDNGNELNLDGILSVQSNENKLECISCGQIGHDLSNCNNNSNVQTDLLDDLLQGSLFDELKVNYNNNEEVNYDDILDDNSESTEIF